MKTRFFLRLAGLAALLAASQSAMAVVAWTDWTAATVGNAGSATGSMLVHGTTISIDYLGDVASPTQTSGGTNYWGPPHPAYNAVNPPSNTDMIAMDSIAPVNIIKFSAPVLNPYMAFISVGQPGLPVIYDFDSPFDVIDSGPAHFGGFVSLTELSGDRLEGREGNGIIQFSGVFTQITFSVSPAEFWHGFTVGTTVPEPGSVALVLLGLAGLAARRRR